MHTTPHLNYTPITSPLTHNLQLSNLDVLNAWGRHVFLTSNDDPTDPPSWLRGDRNVPAGSDKDCHGDGDGDGDGGSDGDGDMGLSSAPAIIIWTEKPYGIVDVFYFYFYSFNLGNTVAGWRFGNHVGDWGVLLTSPPSRESALTLTGSMVEHTMVRFVDGQPIKMFFSEHSGGSAYRFAAVEKIGRRVRKLPLPCSGTLLTAATASGVLGPRLACKLCHARRPLLRHPPAPAGRPHRQGPPMGPSQEQLPISLRPRHRRPDA